MIRVATAILPDSDVGQRPMESFANSTDLGLPELLDRFILCPADYRCQKLRDGYDERGLQQTKSAAGNTIEGNFRKTRRFHE